MAVSCRSIIYLIAINHNEAVFTEGTIFSQLKYSNFTHNYPVMKVGSLLKVEVIEANHYGVNEISKMTQVTERLPDLQ